MAGVTAPGAKYVGVISGGGVGACAVAVGAVVGVDAGAVGDAVAVGAVTC